MARKKGITNEKAKVISADVYTYRLKYRYKWSVIARIFGYGTEAGVIRAARKHALSHGLEWPLTRLTIQEQCYYEFLKGSSWSAIADELCLKKASYAKKNAYRYSIKEGLVWPPPSSLGGYIYEDLKAGLTPSQVARKHNLEDRLEVLSLARNYAKKSMNPWPVD